MSNIYYFIQERCITVRHIVNGVCINENDYELIKMKLMFELDEVLAKIREKVLIRELKKKRKVGELGTFPETARLVTLSLVPYSLRAYIVQQMSSPLAKKLLIQLICEAARRELKFFFQISIYMNIFN